jgi:signal transduction histidine kinase
MITGLRKTGIGVIGDIPWGIHLCHFYETKQDLLDILIPYFKTGLENNEFCMWVVFPPRNEAEMRNALRRAFPKADRHLAAGDLEIIQHSEWYPKDRVLDPQRVIHRWQEKLIQALKRGFAGMRVNVNGTWLMANDWKDFVAYEKRLDEFVANKRMIVLCTYPLAVTKVTELIDVAHTHQLAIVKRQGDWEVVQTLELKQDEAQIKLKEHLLQNQENESIGRFVGGVAHDFNNMLWLIIGNAEQAMLGVNPDEPAYENLQQILRTAQRSAGLVQQLLGFARKRALSPNILNLNDTVSGMLEMLRGIINDDIDLVWMPADNLWLVKIDPSQIDQVLTNLMLNARDAIAGAGKVSIKTDNVTLDKKFCENHAGCVPGDYVFLEVKDDGSGMDHETLSNIFEPFFTTKEMGKGTGLGLSTVYDIVKQNDGYINVCSEPGEGTTFKIYLPRFKSESAEVQMERGEVAPQGDAQ